MIAPRLRARPPAVAAKPPLPVHDTLFGRMPVLRVKLPPESKTPAVVSDRLEPIEPPPSNRMWLMALTPEPSWASSVAPEISVVPE